jgi:hypothetical protein
MASLTERRRHQNIREQKAKCKDEEVIAAMRRFHHLDT